MHLKNRSDEIMNFDARTISGIIRDMISFHQIIIFITKTKRYGKR